MSKKKIDSKTKKKINLFSRIIGVIFFITYALFLGLLIYMNVLPTKYLSIVIIGLSVIMLILEIILFLPKIKSKIKILINIIAVILSIVFGIGSYYLYNTVDFLTTITGAEDQLENYYVVVLDNDTFDKIGDLKGYSIGIYKSGAETFDQAVKKLEQKVKSKNKEYTELTKLGKDLLDENIDAMFISESYKGLLEEELTNLASETKIIDTISIKIEKEDISKKVNVTNESFNIFVSGIDTYGKIQSVSRSDVNMVVTVNPSTNKILLTSIPRDYYVQLHGTTGLKDKLTHAGIYGVDKSVKTIEDLFETDINYYVRVNFTTLIDVVDIIGGIDVYSDKNFMAYTDNSCFYKKGNNHMDGKHALAFARERYAYQEGDRHRVQNQQAVITAIMNKVLSSKTIITKYNSLLKSLDGSFETNMKTNELTKLIKNQIDSMPSWSIESQSVNGRDSSNYTYSYAGQKLYVMEPDMNTVNEAKLKIEEVLKD